MCLEECPGAGEFGAYGCCTAGYAEINWKNEVHLERAEKTGKEKCASRGSWSGYVRKLARSGPR